jgi:hypothetical protein
VRTFPTMPIATSCTASATKTATDRSNIANAVALITLPSRASRRS